MKKNKISKIKSKKKNKISKIKSKKGGKKKKLGEEQEDVNISISSKINNSLYPFWYKKIDFPKCSNKELTDESKWKEHLKLANDLYKNKSLPKGTILYHGSGVKDPVSNLRMIPRPFFFGLDAFIAIWYISEYARLRRSYIETLLESINNYRLKLVSEIDKYSDDSMWERTIKKNNIDINNIKINENKLITSLNELNNIKQVFNKKIENISELLLDLKSNIRRYYFLNIYETQEDINYDYLDKSIQFINPSDVDKCEKNACMHPQYGYHINELEPPVELSMEFTIPADKIGKKIKLIGVYLIDVFKLNENKNKNFNEFKAIESIVLKS